MLDVNKPTLIINKNLCINNIKKILEICINNNIRFRPHFKTHQSLEVGKWFKQLGIKSITVSSVSMAEYFSDHWDDITIAFPFNILEIDIINDLSKYININLLIDCYETLRILEKKLNNKVGIYLKIDVGYNRAGLIHNNYKNIDKIIKQISNKSNFNLNGFISHFGNTYNSKNISDVKNIFKISIDRLEKLSKKYNHLDFSIGDTPSASIIEKYPEFIKEIRPGNFIYYDLSQYKIGSCNLKDISIRMVCPVVSIYKARKEILIYGGAIHFSKDYIIENKNKCFGYVYKGDNYWDLSNKIGYIKSLSQEHGIVKLNKTVDLSIGDKLSIIPVHSCLTADKMGKIYYNKKEISMMRI